jgi:hypothetical protein
MQSFSLGLLAMLYGGTGVMAQQTAFYVAPGGLGANDCLTLASACSSAQQAANLCPTGKPCDLLIAAGAYHEKVSVTYYKQVNFRGDCSKPHAVLFDDFEGETPVAGPIFWIQDQAIGTVSCVGLKGYAKGTIGISSRQGAIVDAVRIDCFSFNGGGCFQATEHTTNFNIWTSVSMKAENGLQAH